MSTQRRSASGLSWKNRSHRQDIHHLSAMWAVLPLTDLPVFGRRDATVGKTITLPMSSSYLKCSKGILWVGNFYHPSADYGLSPEIPYTTNSAGGEYGCYILGYRLGDGGLTIPMRETYPVPDVVLVAPDKIQGMVRLADGAKAEPDLRM